MAKYLPTTTFSPYEIQQLSGGLAKVNVSKLDTVYKHALAARAAQRMNNIQKRFKELGLPATLDDKDYKQAYVNVNKARVMETRRKNQFLRDIKPRKRRSDAGLKKVGAKSAVTGRVSSALSTKNLLNRAPVSRPKYKNFSFEGNLATFLLGLPGVPTFSPVGIRQKGKTAVRRARVGVRKTMKNGVMSVRSTMDSARTSAKPRLKAGIRQTRKVVSKVKNKVQPIFKNPFQR